MSESIEMQNDAFSCRTLNDLAVIEIGEQGSKIGSDLDVRKTLFTLFSRIEQSPSIKGMAIFNTTAYPGDESYRSFLNTVMGGGDRSRRASGLLVHRFGNAVSQVVLRLAQFPKPLVAGMSGTLTGEELGVLLACDFRFATSDVTFTFPNLALGFPPTGALVFYLLHFLGPAETTRLLYSTKSLPVSEALGLGLVSATVPKNKLDTQCMEKLTELAALPPLAFAATRRMIQPDPLELSRFLDHSQETAWDALVKMDKVF